MLVRWLCSRYEKYSVKLTRLLHFFGNAQMCKVDRIECAAEDACFHSLAQSEGRG